MKEISREHADGVVKYGDRWLTILFLLSGSDQVIVFAAWMNRKRHGERTFTFPLNVRYKGFLRFSVAWKYHCWFLPQEAPFWWSNNHRVQIPTAAAAAAALQYRGRRVRHVCFTGSTGMGRSRTLQMLKQNCDVYLLINSLVGFDTALHYICCSICME